MDHPDKGAGFKFSAIGTGSVPFGSYTNPDLALFTVAQFDPFLPASRTIDHFNGQTGGIELCGPFLNCCSSELIIIVHRRDPRFTFGAIQTAAGYQFFHQIFVLIIYSLIK
jgi:hypothetical protein